MKKADLKKWKNNWSAVDSIILWGYGYMCNFHLNFLRQRYKIEAIVDNDTTKSGIIVYNIPVVHSDQIDLKNKKIVITTSYDEISNQLIDLGLVEYIDFCELRLFITGMEWFKHQQVVLSEVNISITTACTLNCKYCNMYMPFHKKNIVMYTLDQIQQQLDLLFSHIDFVIKLTLLGGEPLLNKDLSKIIEYCRNKYKDKISNIGIVTNGTVIPNENLLKELKEENVSIIMSDYNLNDSYSCKFEQVKSILEKNDINVDRSSSVQWKDFSFPYKGLKLSDELAYENMNKCHPVFKGFNDSKFYFCHLVWSADKAGIYKEQPQDYIDFNEHDKNKREKIVMMNICCYEEKYNSLCKECGGCSNLNQKFIKAGEQI